MDSMKISTASATGNPRNKTALKPGRSLMDWIRLTNSSADLSGVGSRLKDVSLEELSRHSTREDAWMAIRGMVYNVSAYFEFHPGGEAELMRGVGTDATDLFDEVHKWVNYESMLKKCLVGRLKTTGAAPTKRPPPAADMKAPPPGPVALPTSDWMQGPEHVSVVVYTRRKNLDPTRVSLALDDNTLGLRIFSEGRACDYRVRLSNSVESSVSLKVAPSTGKVEVILRKKKHAMQWIGLQWPSLGDVELTPFRPVTSPFFRKATLVEKERVNHNVDLFTFSFRVFDSFSVPIGHHVQLKIRLQDGSEVVRSYTPVTDLTKSTDCPEISETSATVRFLIKKYPDGPFTAQLDRLDKGDAVEISDPMGRFDASLLDGKQRLVALAAGTGITPMIRLILHCLESDRKVTLVFFNRREEDIIWRERLDELKGRFEETFEMWHVLSEPEEEWAGLRGRISQSILASALRSDVAGSVTCVCGPSQFTQDTLRLLDEAGCEGGSVHAFAG